MDKKEKIQRWKEIQDLARLVIKENGGHDIRFSKEGEPVVESEDLDGIKRQA